MFEKSKKIIHPILFAIFPIFFIYVNNLQEISPQELFLPLTLIVGTSIVIWLVLRLILKSTIKSALIVSLLVILIFSYGHIYRLADDLSFNDMDIGRHRYLIIPFLLVSIIGITYFIRTQRKLDNVTTITNVIAATLIIIIIINMGVYSTQNSKNFYNNFETNEDKSNIKVDVGQNLPDIYYIILDGYANTNSLKETLGFDNSDFILFLKNQGFYVVNKSHSNYPITPSSIGSLLNMKYINYLSDDVGSQSIDLHPQFKLITDNTVMKTLKQKGYTIVNFENRAVYPSEFKNVDLHLCENKSLFKNKLLDTLGRTSIIVYFVEKWAYQDVRNVHLCVFSELPKIAKMSEPTFVFAHIILPHPPYVFGSNGEPMDPIRPEGIESWENSEGYLNQLQFTNKKIKEVVNKLLESDKKSIIILQSDHGSAFGVDFKNPDENMLRQRMSNFMAYYLPDLKDNPIYENITPVNSFRIVFNAYFNDDYKILNDNMYWAWYDQPYNFKNVTNYLDSSKHYN